VLTAEQLLYCLLVPSANDAAVALAQATAGSIKGFVDMMNAKAKSLDLSNTHFVNPSGLHAEKHFSSAKDLATLTEYAMQDPVFRRIVATHAYDLPRPGQEATAGKALLMVWDAWNRLTQVWEDTNEDGDLDVATTESSSGKVAIFLNDGTGHFTNSGIYFPHGSKGTAAMDLTGVSAFFRPGASRRGLHAFRVS
jgi:hypothetical protein